MKIRGYARALLAAGVFAGVVLVSAAAVCAEDAYWKPVPKVPALPPKGSFGFELDGTAFAFADGDMVDIYGPGLESGGFTGGWALGLGLSYALTRELQLRLLFQPLISREYIVSFVGGGEEKWDLNAMALLGGGRYYIPAGSGLNLYLGAALGSYALRNSKLTSDFMPGFDLNLEGSTLGGLFEFGGHKYVSENVAVMAGLVYNYASISPVKGKFTFLGSSGPEFDLWNYDGSNARIDFSGFGIFLKMMLTFGGTPEAPAVPQGAVEEPERPPGVE